MLSKILANSQLSRAATFMGFAARRGVYTNETRPYVFINEHTKVICQGMTGKHVSFSARIDRKICSSEMPQILVCLTTKVNIYFFRVLSTLSKLSPMALKLLLE